MRKGKHKRFDINFGLRQDVYVFRYKSDFIIANQDRQNSNIIEIYLEFSKIEHSRDKISEFRKLLAILKIDCN